MTTATQDRTTSVLGAHFPLQEGFQHSLPQSEVGTGERPGRAFQLSPPESGHLYDGGKIHLR